MIELDRHNGAAAGAEQFEVAVSGRCFTRACFRPALHVTNCSGLRAAAGFESFLLVEPGSTGFCISDDHSSDTWLRARGASMIAESETLWGFGEMYLTGDFAVSVQEDAVPSEGLE